jgi:hypothetical protein
MRNVGLHVIVSLLLRRGHEFPDLTMIHKAMTIAIITTTMPVASL